MRTLGKSSLIGRGSESVHATLRHVLLLTIVLCAAVLVSSLALATANERRTGLEVSPSATAPGANTAKPSSAEAANKPGATVIGQNETGAQTTNGKPPNCRTVERRVGKNRCASRCGRFLNCRGEPLRFINCSPSACSTR